MCLPTDKCCCHHKTPNYGFRSLCLQKKFTMSTVKLLHVFKNTTLRAVYPYCSLIPSPSSLADPNRTAATSPAATRGQHRRTGVGASPYSPPLPPFVDKTPQNCCHRFCCHQGTVHSGGIGAPSPKDSVPPSESSLGVDGLPSPEESLLPCSPSHLTHPPPSQAA